MQRASKYLFLDRGTVNGHRCANAEIRLCRAVKDVSHNPLFLEGSVSVPPRPWEARIDNGYPNVFFDEEHGIFRLYYTLFTDDRHSRETPRDARPGTQYVPGDDRITSVCYAWSRDGVEWHMPELGLVEHGGGKANNILMRNAHGTCVFLDRAETDPSRRYKLMTKVEYSRDNRFMAVAFSADGVHFCDPIPWPKHNPQADTYNFTFRDPRTNRFVLITRIWKNGVRIAAKCESDDFLSWSEPREIARGDGFADQVYSMPVFAASDIYLGLASMYHEGDRDAPDFDRVDLSLKFATDLDHFDSIEKGGVFIERGAGSYPDGDFDCGCVYASTPVEIDGKLWFYYMGGNGQHTNFRETSFARAWIEKDRFACYRASDPARDAVLVTSPANFYGNGLRLLADVEEGGSILCELVDRGGRAVIEGFGGGDAQRITAGGWSAIAFPGRSLTETGNVPVALRFTFRKARLYALEGDFRMIKRD